MPLTLAVLAGNRVLLCLGIRALGSNSLSALSSMAEMTHPPHTTVHTKRSTPHTAHTYTAHTAHTAHSKQQTAHTHTPHTAHTHTPRTHTLTHHTHIQHTLTHCIQHTRMHPALYTLRTRTALSYSRPLTQNAETFLNKRLLLRHRWRLKAPARCHTYRVRPQPLTRAP